MSLRCHLFKRQKETRMRRERSENIKFQLCATWLRIIHVGQRTFPFKMRFFEHKLQWRTREKCVLMEMEERNPPGFRRCGCVIFNIHSAEIPWMKGRFCCMEIWTRVACVHLGIVLQWLRGITSWFVFIFCESVWTFVKKFKFSHFCYLSSTFFFWGF